MKKFTWMALLCTVLCVPLLSACSLIPLPGMDSSYDSSMDAIDESAGQVAPDLVDPGQPDVQTSAFSRGIWNGSVYQNDFMGLTFTKPEGWVAATDQELANMLGIVLDSMDDLDQRLLERAQQTSVYDMMVADFSSGDNIIVCLENIVAASPIAQNLTESNYFQILERQLSQTYTVDVQVVDDTGTCQINGNLYYVMHLDIPGTGQQYYVTRRIGDYMASLIMTSTSGRTLDGFLAMFA